LHITVYDEKNAVTISIFLNVYVSPTQLRSASKELNTKWFEELIITAKEP